MDREWKEGLSQLRSEVKRERREEMAALEIFNSKIKERMQGWEKSLEDS